MKEEKKEGERKGWGKKGKELIMAMSVGLFLEELEQKPTVTRSHKPHVWVLPWS